MAERKSSSGRHSSKVPLRYRARDPATLISEKLGCRRTYIRTCIRWNVTRRLASVLLKSSEIGYSARDHRGSQNCGHGAAVRGTSRHSRSCQWHTRRVTCSCDGSTDRFLHFREVTRKLDKLQLCKIRERKKNVSTSIYY